MKQVNLYEAKTALSAWSTRPRRRGDHHRQERQGQGQAGRLERGDGRASAQARIRLLEPLRLEAAGQLRRPRSGDRSAVLRRTRSSRRRGSDAASCSTPTPCCCLRLRRHGSLRPTGAQALSRESPLYVSQVCAIEIAIKASIGKLDLAAAVSDRLSRRAFAKHASIELGADLLPDRDWTHIDQPEPSAAASPRPVRPADHRAGAWRTSLTVVTRDRAFAAYAGLEVSRDLTHAPLHPTSTAAPRRCTSPTSTPTRSSPSSSSRPSSARAWARACSTTCASTSDGRPKPDFVLNQPAYAGAERADRRRQLRLRLQPRARALGAAGLRRALRDRARPSPTSSTTTASRTASCRSPCRRTQVRALMDEAKGGNHVFSVDLEAQTVTAPSGQTFRFEIDPAARKSC